MGETQHIFDGCAEEGATQWQRLHIAFFRGTAGTVAVALRHAPDRSTLASVAFDTLGTLPEDEAPFALDLPDGGVVEVRLTLSTEARDGAPRVQRVGVEWGCPGPG